MNLVAELLERQRRSELQDSSCVRCNLNKYVSCVCMEGEGSLETQVMLVGEAPGQVEDQQGVPFVGRAGKYLEKHILLECGIDDVQRLLRLTNAARCRPPDNRAPRSSELAKCRAYLEEEIISQERQNYGKGQSS